MTAHGTATGTQTTAGGGHAIVVVVVVVQPTLTGTMVDPQPVEQERRACDDDAIRVGAAGMGGKRRHRRVAVETYDFRKSILNFSLKMAPSRCSSASAAG